MKYENWHFKYLDLSGNVFEKIFFTDGANNLI